MREGHGQTKIKTTMYLMLYNKIITIVSESLVGMGVGGIGSWNGEGGGELVGDTCYIY